jgi:hypothetical protein
MQLFCFGLCGSVGLVGNIWVIYTMTERKLYSFFLCPNLSFNKSNLVGL